MTGTYDDISDLYVNTLPRPVCCLMIVATYWFYHEDCYCFQSEVVLWHCWLSHQTCRNVVPEMTCTVSSGTFNLTQSIQSEVLVRLTDILLPVDLSQRSHPWYSS